MSLIIRAYSLGYQGISLDRYVEVLKANGITTVIDVRETPWSYKPGFSKKPLAERLNADGICYVHLKSAGNPSKNRKMGLPSSSVMDLYRAHLDENPICLTEILALMEQSRGAVCLLCYEERPHECHRTIILDTLAERGHGVVTCHLHGRQGTSEQTIAPKWVPEANDCKGPRVHVEIAEDECGIMPILA